MTYNKKERKSVTLIWARVKLKGDQRSSFIDRTAEFSAWFGADNYRFLEIKNIMSILIFCNHYVLKISQIERV